MKAVSTPCAICGARGSYDSLWEVTLTAEKRPYPGHYISTSRNRLIICDTCWHRLVLWPSIATSSFPAASAEEHPGTAQAPGEHAAASGENAPIRDAGAQETIL